MKFYHCPRCNKDYREHDPCAYGDTDCCPECGWQPGYKYCSECESEMERIQVYDSMPDYYGDGPYRFVWKCKKCGHEEPVEVKKP
jgi:hypothetical protein